MRGIAIALLPLLCGCLTFHTSAGAGGEQAASASAKGKAESGEAHVNMQFDEQGRPVSIDVVGAQARATAEGLAALKQEFSAQATASQKRLDGMQVLLYLVGIGLAAFYLLAQAGKWGLLKYIKKP